VRCQVKVLTYLNGLNGAQRLNRAKRLNGLNENHAKRGATFNHDKINYAAK